MNSNVSNYLQYPRKVLRLFGLWPMGTRSTILEIYRALIILEQYLFLYFNGVYIFMMRGDVQAMSDACYLFFTQLALCCRATAFALDRNAIKKVLISMDDDIFKAECEHNKNSTNYPNKIKYLYIVLVISFFTTLLWWMVASLFAHDERRYPYNEIWFPVDIQKSPQYEIAYVYEVLAIISSGLTFLSVDTFSVATMLFVCSQFDMLKQKMEKIKPVSVTKKFNKERKERQEEVKNNNILLVEFIKHHQAIKRFIVTLLHFSSLVATLIYFSSFVATLIYFSRFVEQIEDTLHWPVFFQLCTTVLIICIIALRLAQDSPANASFYGILSYFILMLSQLYLYCWCGTELTDKSLDFRDWMYELPWYDQDKKFNSTLCILLECTKKPLLFRAGHYILLARATFVSVLRCSYSYFAVLQQANE